MTIDKVEGIIINETNYSESSKILNILTKEYGLIGVISKGCRKTKSSLRSVSTKFIYGYFHIYYKKDGLSTLIDVDLIDSFKNIRSDIDKITYLSYITELVDQVSKQTEENIFSLYVNSVKKIEEGMDPEIITNILEIKLLDVLGIMPIIDACSLCGNTDDIVTIDVDSGGYVCKNCYTNERIYSDKMFKLIRMFYYVDIEKITKLSISDSVKKELNEFIDNYYDKYTGLYLKSKSFIKNLKKINN